MPVFASRLVSSPSPVQAASYPAPGKFKGGPTRAQTVPRPSSGAFANVSPARAVANAATSPYRHAEIQYAQTKNIPTVIVG